MRDKRQDSEALELTQQQRLAESQRVEQQIIAMPDSSFATVLQSKPVNAMLSSTTKVMQIDGITGGGEINVDGVKWMLDPEAVDELSELSKITFILVLAKAAKQLPKRNEITAEKILKNSKVEISLGEYMERRKLKDIKSARQQLNSAILSLYGSSMEWDEEERVVPEGKRRAVKMVNSHKLRIAEESVTQVKGKAVRNGKASLTLSFKFALYIASKYQMPIPLALCSINPQYNPYSVSLGWKLCSLDNVNLTDNHPERVGKTTIKTLLNAAKGIPRYADIAEKGQVFDRIIKPFDRDMKALIDIGVLDSYHYSDKEGNVVDNLAALNYAEFSSLNVAYHIKGYPDQTPRLEAAEEQRQKRRERAIRRRQQREKRAADQETESANEKEPE